MSILTKLDVPVIAAPMAGGPSTPQLAAAVAGAGGLGFIAGGTMPAEQFTALLADADATGARYGVNLFARQNPYHSLDQVEQVADLVRGCFAERGLDGPVIPSVDYDFDWAAKLDAVCTALDAGAGPAVVSVTFGTFTSEEVDRLHAAGAEAWVTVTNERDALAAERTGADALVVQGPEAGGHRATWTVETIPDLRPLHALTAAVHEATETGVPLVAAGGLGTPGHVAEALAAPGVRAVACGTAFLLADEAGTSRNNRRMLAAAEAPTDTTRAFSGRHARGLATEFTRAHRELPPSYPHLNMMLKPLRDDPDFAYCLAGENYALAEPGPAADILAGLAAQVRR